MFTASGCLFACLSLTTATFVFMSVYVTDDNRDHVCMILCLFMFVYVTDDKRDHVCVILSLFMSVYVNDDNRDHVCVILSVFMSVYVTDDNRDHVCMILSVFMYLNVSDNKDHVARRCNFSSDGCTNSVLMFSKPADGKGECVCVCYK